MDPTHESCE